MEIEQLRERNKELERLAHLGHGLRFISKNISVSDYAYKIHVQEMDALYAKLFPPKPPEAKFTCRQFLVDVDSARLLAWKPVEVKFSAAEGWRYHSPSGAWYDESELSALSEEEAGRA